MLSSQPLPFIVQPLRMRSSPTHQLMVHCVNLSLPWCSVYSNVGEFYVGSEYCCKSLAAVNGSSLLYRRVLHGVIGER